MRKAFIFFVLLISPWLFQVSLVYAHEIAPAPHVSIAIPTPDAAQRCDICGSCYNQATQVNDEPGDYDQCVLCLTKNTAGHPPEHKWTPLGCLPTSPGLFTQVILRVFVSIVGGVAFLAILYGGGLILFSNGIPERVETGRSILISSVAGVLLVIFAVFILEFIGLEIFGLPGFGG
ncbi:hypothetical protein COW99_05620 [Candidatus Roizmanbacteria bacterium CG22_combo_CG10-13_8_21_14_all_38_20]|uniref:Uncharacterized protein n=1 Tax=Candidatus Roizmanbacteria bacterium CG22_combo_CG10-13_8_21_14_all_38_20 TaxID=1974862 RepID=A0A2H0BU80_9BACT|nr:hypothetical protein [Candidatus Microgenomates bacterium]PIP61233.1 MAG: hypothetical protein COW99_05620 [Candidatus Roizmanbacteria bacterium CG22_combo_CG10-13_8_21_14_all_38_20]PJC31223.1 MAG: hypothetical protein CO050_04280 [Candidatus Roizmanbacteria bacterium CG_4_9_14_0_2_um_filter_38_17]